MKLNTKKLFQVTVRAALYELITQIVVGIALRRLSYEDRKIAVKKAWEMMGYDY